MRAFTLSRIPKTFYGNGALDHVLSILKELECKKLLLITGGSSFRSSPYHSKLREGLGNAGINVAEAKAGHEPSPELVDKITETARSEGSDTVLAIGGGSVLDAGKAVSAMAKITGSVMDYLEGVGNKVHLGTKLPYIAVPTTSGTGSEATKNAVISRVGLNGFKKSLRHDHFVPDYAILDPELTVNLPVPITAASGMDALNQLLEGYLSVKASPFTDSLAISGIQKVFNALEPLCLDNPQDTELRGDMAYAAYLSGIVLANAGLGYVHGFAGIIGGLADIPHGVVCGKLNACIFEAVSKAIVDNKDACYETYFKLLMLSDALGERASGTKRIFSLIDRLYKLEESMNLPSFSSYGINQDLIISAVSSTSGKESPVKLSTNDLIHLVMSKL